MALLLFINKCLLKLREKGRKVKEEETPKLRVGTLHHNLFMKALFFIYPRE